MNITGMMQILAGLAALFSVSAFTWRLVLFNRLARPAEKSRPKGDVSAGIRYAYALGMAPWSKESTRRHWVAYLRGIAFHLAIFLCLALLLASPWVGRLPGLLRIAIAACAGLGAILGLAGVGLRMVDRNLKSISTPDDYFAALAVSVFLAAAAGWLFFPPVLPVFYLVSGVMLVYAPLGKIRHCIYFAYSRLFFGRYVGIRGVLPHGQQGVRV